MNKPTLAAILALGLLVSMAGHRIMDLERALAAKPKIEIRTVEKVKTVRVAGPVQVVERIVIAKDGTKTIERTTERAEVVTNTGKESANERSEAPACAPVKSYNRVFALVVDPLLETKVEGARVGLTIFDRLDLSAGYRFNGRAVGPFADVGGRF